MLRNKTVAVSSILLPVGLGVFWAFQFRSDGDPARQAVGVALQLAVALGMGIYVTATQTIVARRHARVLKRMRTSGLSDGGLLVATMAPSVVLGLVQLAVFAVVNVVTGAPQPSDPVPLAARGARRAGPRRHGGAGDERRHAVAGTGTDHDAAADVRDARRRRRGSDRAHGRAGGPP